jgi:hypothetical protein
MNKRNRSKLVDLKKVLEDKADAARISVFHGVEAPQIKEEPNWENAAEDVVLTADYLISHLNWLKFYMSVLAELLSAEEDEIVKLRKRLRVIERTVTTRAQRKDGLGA